MDPLSIAASAAALTTLTWQISNTLYSFISETLEVDETIKSLHVEVTNLASVIKSIQNILQSVKLGRVQQSDLWSNVHDCLQATQRTVGQLNDIVQKVGPADKNKNFFRKAIQQLKLNLSQPGVAELRSQLNTHTSTMQLAFSMINVYLTTIAPGFVIDELAPKLDLLIKQNERLTAALGQSGPDGEENLIKNLKNSADKITSNATVIVSSGSTAWGGSQSGEKDLGPPPPFREVDENPQRQHHLTTGSELGDPLSEDKYSSISSWIQPPSLEPVEELADAQHEIRARTDLHTDLKVASPGAGPVPSEPPKHPQLPSPHEDEYDSDDEMEMRLIDGHLKISKRKATGAANLQESEQSLRRAMEGISKLKIQNQTKYDTKTMTHDLIVLSMKQQKYDAAQDLCENLRRDAIVKGQDPTAALEASFMLAQTCYLQNQLEAAKVECRQVMKVTGRLPNASEKAQKVYHDSIALLMMIHEAQNNSVDAKALSTMLPPGYVRPRFDNGASMIPGSNATTADVDLRLVKSITRSATADSTRSKQSQATVRPTNPRTSGIQPLDRAQAEQASQFLHRECPTKVTSETKDLDEALLWATREGHEEIATMLLDGQTLFKSFFSSKMKPAENARPSVAGIQRALEVAVQANRPKLVRHLVGEGADVGAPASDVENRRRRKDQVPYFGSDLKIVHIAASDPRSSDALIALVESGADPSTLSSNRTTPMMLASYGGNHAAIDILLDRHADTSLENDQGFSALGLAIIASHIDIVDILLSAHAKPTSGSGLIATEKGQPPQRRAPLQVAVAAGKIAIVRKLLAQGASPNCGSVQNRLTEDELPLSRAAKDGNKDILALLLEKGADPAMRDVTGRSALHTATASSQEGCTRILIAHDANVNAQDDTGLTPLHTAAFSDSEACVSLLLERRAQVNVGSNKGVTPFLAAATVGSLGVMRLLRNAGADPLAADVNGKTALMLAAAAGSRPCVEYLFSSASELTRRTDKYGRNAAMFSRGLEMKRVFRRQGLSKLH